MRLRGGGGGGGSGGGRPQRTADWRRHDAVRREDQVMMNSLTPDLIRVDSAAATAVLLLGENLQQKP